MDNNSISYIRTFCALILLSTVFCSCETSPGEASSTTVRISPRLPENAIRATILTDTPIGSSAGEVLKFAHTRLKHVHKEMDYYDKANHEIVILLGHYGLGGETYVTWKFDEEGKLIELFVEKDRDLP